MGKQFPAHKEKEKNTMKYDVTRSEAMELAIALVSEGKAIPEEKKTATLDALCRIARSLAKSSSKKSGGKTEAQMKADIQIQEKIMGVLDSTTGKRAGEIGALVGISQSKATAMLKVLVEAGDASRTVEKGVAKYKATAPAVIEIEMEGDDLMDEDLPDLTDGDDYYEKDEIE
jgi:hypothetical protein